MDLVGNSSTSIISICSNYTTTNVAAFNDRNNQFVFNTQNHLQISEDHGIASNSVNVLNDDDRHYNDNFNSHRDETLKVNEIDKPDNN